MTRNWPMLVWFASALCAAPQASLAACNAGGSVGLELGRGVVRDAALNPQGSFSEPKSYATLYSDVIADCFSDVGKLHIDAYGERIESTGNNGLAQEREGNEVRGFMREAYLSLSPGESLFIDIGKKDIRNGQFFFVSPLDFLQNPANYSSRAVINATGVSWRDNYREGALLMQASWFNKFGTLELAVLPKLANDSAKERVAEWSGLQRTNSQERFYAAYTTSVLDDFNPRLVLLGGDRKGAGIGTGGFLTDDWILNVEFSATDKSDIRKASSLALDKFNALQLPSADEIFVEQKESVFYQFAAGLRYTTEANLAISLEYLYQDQGLGSNEWDDYFDIIDISERAFQFSGAELFRGYQLLFAQEADNNARRDLMMGRQYAMVHLQRDSAELQKLSWETSTIYNIEDRSYAVNLQLSSQLSRHVELYLGGGYLGGPDRSEFGRLGASGVGYAGIRAIW
jgi:hypothetical protein